MVLGDLDSYMQKKWNLTTNLHLTQNKLKMDKRLKYLSHDTIKALEEDIGKKISDIPYVNIFTNSLLEQET